MRFLVLVLCSFILLFACGSDEIPEPIETKPNYFPDAIGSRWVYRSAEGLQWTQEITEEKTIDDKNYRILEDTPTILETKSDFLKPAAFRASQNQIHFNVGEKINRYLQTELPNAVQDEFTGLDVDVTVESTSYPELLFFQIPLIPNSEWDALNVVIHGNFILQDLILLHIPFEVRFRIKGEVIGEEAIETPAGRFENTFQIRYTTETTHILFSNEESVVHHQTIWFVPHVGIVKIENEHGVTELIETTLAPTVEA